MGAVVAATVAVDSRVLVTVCDAAAAAAAAAAAQRSEWQRSVAVEMFRGDQTKTCCCRVVFFSATPSRFSLSLI